MSEEMIKPRICEVLGVEVGQKFQINIQGDIQVGGTFEVTPFGEIAAVGVQRPRDVSIAWLEQAINHPECIVREPKLSEKEREICKTLGAKWVSMDFDRDSWVRLWRAKPVRSGPMWWREREGDMLACVCVGSGLFDNIVSGELISVEDLV